MTLDGQERTLTSQMLLIADETKAVALAGVMGGQNSEINPDTVDVLIESAYFKPQNIRATSKKLELRTESSYRFERGARHRHLRLGQPARGPVDPRDRRRHALPQGVVDAYPNPGRAEANHAAPPQGQRAARHRSAPRSKSSPISASLA